jgi:hypothetical protein
MLGASLHLSLVTITSASVCRAETPAERPAEAPVSPSAATPGATPAVTPAATPVAKPTATPAADTIYLKEGSVLRGTLVDAVPGHPVRIQLATGEISTVASDDVDHIELAEAAEAAEVARQAKVAPALKPLPSVLVHIAGEEPLAMERTADGDTWLRVCTAPCNARLPTIYAYRIVGRGIRNSEVFALSAQDGQEESIEVHPAYSSSRTGGTLALIAGCGVGVSGFGAFALGGTGLMLWGSDPTYDSGLARNVMLGGLVAMGFGVLLVVSGATTLASTRASAVEQQEIPQGTYAPSLRGMLPAVSEARVLSVRF